jgi:hypothetical protein
VKIYPLPHPEYHPRKQITHGVETLLERPAFGIQVRFAPAALNRTSIRYLFLMPV